MDISRLESALSLAEEREGLSCFHIVTDGNDDITIEDGMTAELLITDSDYDAVTNLTVSEMSRLSVVHVVTNPNRTQQLNVTVDEGCEFRMTQVVLAASDVTVDVKLAGQNAMCDTRGIFVLTDDERGTVTVNVDHSVSDCTSHTTVKGVASGNAKGQFAGLIYVAPDAQRTDAQQMSRNVVLGTAQIDTRPQLEIYADDVKCSHGATVGQMDTDAVLYMRQRGLSLADAKRLQLEGFVSDVVMHSAIERLAEPLQELLADKFNRL